MSEALEVTVRRVLDPKEAGTLVGEPVRTMRPTVPRPMEDGPVIIRDGDTGEVVGIVSRMPRERLAMYRAAVLELEMSTVARMGKKMPGGGRTFGWAPKRPMANGRETCRATTTARQHPEPHKVLVSTAGWLTEEFRRLHPTREAQDRAVLDQVAPDWKMEEGALWTSGVVNRTAELPYHRDGMNFHTWSAMPSLRFGVDGGHLHVPEYGMVFPVGDGDVTWFCGRDLVHGVTPMHVRKPDGYRYSIVYYALKGMKDCRTFAEETTQAAARRTARERAIAAEVRRKLEAREAAGAAQ